MAFSMADGGASGPQINVTPRVDVLLTPSIMFMLVVSLDPQHGEKRKLRSRILRTRRRRLGHARWSSMWYGPRRIKFHR